MLTVACVLRSGGVYDPSWVAKLRKGVAQHLPIEHRFVCISDQPVDCERIPLRNYWPGWWSKIEVFLLPGPMLFFDLDTLIIGDLSELAEVAMSTPFAALRNFRVHDGLGSGVMAWGAGVDLSDWHRRFSRDPAEWMRLIGSRGDQGFVEEVADLGSVVRLQDVVPRQIMSFKDDVPNRTSHPHARVMCLHGKPKFLDMPVQHWVRRKWEDL